MPDKKFEAVKTTIISKKKLKYWYRILEIVINVNILLTRKTITISSNYNYNSSQSDT